MKVDIFVLVAVMKHRFELVASVVGNYLDDLFHVRLELFFDGQFREVV